MKIEQTLREKFYIFKIKFLHLFFFFEHEATYSIANVLKNKASRKFGKNLSSDENFVAQLEIKILNNLKNILDNCTILICINVSLSSRITISLNLRPELSGFPE